MVYVDKGFDTQYGINMEVIPKYSKKFMNYLRDIFNSVNKLFCNKDNDSNGDTNTFDTKVNVKSNAFNMGTVNHIQHDVKINPHFMN